MSISFGKSWLSVFYSRWQRDKLMPLLPPSECPKHSENFFGVSVFYETVVPSTGGGWSCKVHSQVKLIRIQKGMQFAEGNWAFLFQSKTLDIPFEMMTFIVSLSCHRTLLHVEKTFGVEPMKKYLFCLVFFIRENQILTLMSLYPAYGAVGWNSYIYPCHIIVCVLCTVCCYFIDVWFLCVVQEGFSLINAAGFMKVQKKGDVLLFQATVKVSANVVI